MMQKLLLTSLFLLFPVIGFAQAQSMTIEQAINTALENNYQIKQAENNRNLADTRVRSAQADFLPSLNAGFNGSRNVGRQFVQEDLSFEDRTTYGLSGSINANVTIFDGFANIAGLRGAQADRESEELNFQRLKENVMFDTASRFLEVVLNRELLKIAESNLEASRGQLERISAEVEVGSRPTVDQYNQESVVANDELTLIQRENALEVSMARLIRIMQDDSITEVDPVMPTVDEMALMPMDLSLNDMISAALEQRSDIRAQEFNIESNQQNYRIARGQYYPTVSASAGFNGSWSDQLRDPITGETVSFSDQFFDQNVRRSLGFSIQIPIFNRWNTRTSIESARVQLKNSELALDNVRFQVTEEVRQAYNDYVSIVKELESSEKALRAAERAYETEQQRYEVGSTTLIELNQANANYVQAQSNRIQAVYNFVFQEKLLDYYIGQLNSEFQF
ncbi:TolC family protein [Rhodohalobacter halophilus]|uniref:TolC family protein n=1 Tax=Rhodohalobacter halophilus TaxID=1812810 RepID=UPI001FDEED32|nr:TolC family protein [Rhodohalobacter halophilus]